MSKKVAAPQFTEIQNRLVELHDKLFPDAKHITPDDANFLRANAKNALKATKLVPEEDLKKAQEECVKLRSMLKIMLDIHGCGCESITDGGWTCPAHEALR